MVSPLLSTLRELTQYCELIIFTFLPMPFVERLLEKVGELRKMFSYVLTREQMTEQDGCFLVKDMGPLLKSRNIKDIIIIDVDETRVDDKYFSSIILQHRYDGSINYSQVFLVIETIKQVVRNHSILYGSSGDGKDEHSG